MFRMEKVNIKRWICVSSVAWLCFVQGCRVKPQMRGRSREGDRVLALLSIEPIAEPDYKGYADANGWWDDLTSALNMEFWRLCWADDYEKHIRRLVHHFGRHGPMVDMKICITDARIMLALDSNQSNQVLPGELRKALPSLARLEARYRQIRNFVAKTQVEMFLKRPDLLDRYYNVVVWSHQFLGSTLGQWWSLMSKVSELAESWRPLYYDAAAYSDYWYYARDFMLVAHATGRDDLLQDVDGGELYQRYEKWDAWLQTNVWGETGWTRLVPHPEKPIWVERDSLLAKGRDLVKEPMFPFPDWDSNVSPPKRSLLSDPLSPLSIFIGDSLVLEECFSPCKKYNSVVEQIQELPHLGKLLSDFPAAGKVTYARLDYCCAVEACPGRYTEFLFAGTMDEADMMNYCRNNGWSFAPAGAYGDQWKRLLHRCEGLIDVKDLTIGASARDYELFKYIETDQRGFCQLRINYNSREKRFVGHTWCLIRKQQPGPEDRSDP